MKAVLKFDLDDRSDDLAHKRCVKALDMAMVIWNFQNSRKELEGKIEKMEESDDPYNVLDLILKHFYEICEEEVVDIESLIE